MTYRISLSIDFLSPPFGNPSQRSGGFIASSPLSLSQYGSPSVHKFECMLSKSTSHTLITKSLVDSFNSLHPPFRWVESSERYFNSHKKTQLHIVDSDITAEPTQTDGFPALNSALDQPFKFTPFDDAQQKRYKFEYFLKNQAVLEKAHQLKVIGSFDFCFCFAPNESQHQHYFRVEKALVIDGELFMRHPDWTLSFPFSSGQTKNGSFSAVLGCNFIENHPYIMYELRGESNFVFSSTLLASRTEALRKENVTKHGANLIVHTAGICENEYDIAVGSVAGGYGIFFEKKSTFNTFRHVSGPSAGTKDSAFRDENEAAVGFGNTAPKDAPTIERVELAALIMAMKIVIRLKVMDYHFNSTTFRHSSNHCNTIFNREITGETEPQGIEDSNQDLIQDLNKVRCAFSQRSITINFEHIDRNENSPAYILARLGQDMWPYTGAMTMVQEPIIPIHIDEIDTRMESRTPSPASAFDESPSTANECFNFPCIQTDIFPSGRSTANSMTRSRSSSIDGSIPGDSPIIQMKKYLLSRNLLPTSKIISNAARGNLLALTNEGLYFVPMHKAVLQTLAADKMGLTIGEEDYNDDGYIEDQIETIGHGVGNLSVITTKLDGVGYY